MGENKTTLVVSRKMDYAAVVVQWMLLLLILSPVLKLLLFFGSICYQLRKYHFQSVSVSVSLFSPLNFSGL